MKYGFTGPESGATHRQLECLRYLFSEMLLTELHHGDCVGGDAQAHRIAKQHGAYVVAHPPKNPKLRAFVKDADEVLPEEDYLPRNRKIVKQGTSGLFACVPTYEEILRSGVWATVRYARKEKRRIWLIYPNGAFKEEPGG